MDSFRLFTKKSHFLICQDKMKHSELLTGVGLTEPPPAIIRWGRFGTSWAPVLYLQRNPWLVLVLPSFGTLRRNCFSPMITPPEGSANDSMPVDCCDLFFVIPRTINRANMSLRVVQWVGPPLRWSPTNQISWFGWCCQVCFGTNSILRIYHPGCTSSTDIHAPPVAPWHLHFCPKAQWHHGFPPFSNYSYL